MMIDLCVFGEAIWGMGKEAESFFHGEEGDTQTVNEEKDSH